MLLIVIVSFCTLRILFVNLIHLDYIILLHDALIHVIVILFVHILVFLLQFSCLIQYRKFVEFIAVIGLSNRSILQQNLGSQID